MITVQEDGEEGEVEEKEEEVEVRAIVTGEPKLSIHALERTFN